MTFSIPVGFIVVGVAGALFIIYRHISKIQGYNKQLFLRAWRFELALMEIYEDCPENVQDKIRQVIETTNELE